MQQMLAALCLLPLLLSFSACRSADNSAESGPPATAWVEPSAATAIQEDETMPQLTVTVGGQSFSATLYDNDTAKALADWLPMTLDMSELNGNEKYHYFSSSLPTDASCPAQIQAGDIMLFGDSCLVLFYKSFSTSYSYTPLGRIDDPSSLAAALGSGDVQVHFQWD